MVYAFSFLPKAEKLFQLETITVMTYLATVLANFLPVIHKPAMHVAHDIGTSHIILLDNTIRVNMHE